MIAQNIIDALDEKALDNRALVEWTRRILMSIGSIDSFEEGILNEDDGDLEKSANEMRARVKSLKQGVSLSRARLFLSAVPSDQELDGYVAEYIIQWATDLGLSESQISLAFHKTLGI